MRKIIKFEDVSFGYENKTILENVNLDINKGDYIGIIGQNGAGKSTLLKLMIHSISPIKGSIELLGKDIENFNS